MNSTPTIRRTHARPRRDRQDRPARRGAARKSWRADARREWTVVRASWFCQNFSEGAFFDMVLAGEIALPAGEVGEPFVDADEIARATGRTIRYVQIPPEAFAAGVAEMGLPEDIAWLLDYLFATVLDGRNAHLGDGVRRALGRKPGDFAAYARRTAAAGVWDVPS